jgi:hypothetical protein
MVHPYSRLQSLEKRMKKTVITFGLISGALSFLLVFFGIRSYRDNIAAARSHSQKLLPSGSPLL